MEVVNRQQIGLARFQPSAGGKALARGTMPIPATAVRYLSETALLALVNVSSQRRRTTGLDRRHYPTLATIEVAGVGLAIGRTVAAEHIRHLQSGASHARCLSPTVSTPAEAASPAP